MNPLILALSACLLLQHADRYHKDEYKIDPQRVPMKKAPAAAMSDDAQESALENLEPPQDDIPPAEHKRPSRYQEEPAEAPAEEPPAERGAHQKPRPPELLAEALEKPVEGALVGTPITLQAALARGTDRALQLRIAQAYWRLSAAQADYHWARSQRDMLGHFAESHNKSAGMLSARASARADVQDTLLAVSQAQHALAELLGGRDDMRDPLASDRPHVGDYRTYFDTIFVNRQAPPRIRLINRTIPLRRRAIDDHAEAIVATLDAVQATGESFQQSGQGLATLLAALELLKHERRAFIADVRDYNQEIAEYAFTVAPANANDRTLVSMLIKTAPQTPKVKRPPADQESDPASGPPEARLTPVRAPWDKNEQVVNYQPDAVEEAGLYHGLLNIANAPVRVDKLGSLLHWDRSLPGDSGTAVTLHECLRTTQPADRLAVISSFWQAREAAARYQAEVERVEQLNALPPIAIHLREQPGMAEASLRLQSARRAAKAAVVDAHRALLAAEFELTEVTHRPLDQPWLVPATSPQTGRYLVATGRSARQHPAAQNWSSAVRRLYETLENRADAVLQADRHRAAMVNETRRGALAEDEGVVVPDEPMRLDGTLRAIQRQHRETLAFLGELTSYNLAITQYALLYLPPSVSNEDLLKMLVISRSTRREA